MELITFKLLLDIGSGLLDMVGKMSGASAERKRKVGEWTHNLGELIRITAEDLEMREFPHTTCAKMRYMVDEFSNMMDGLLDADKIKSLQSDLSNAAKLEGLYFELRDLDQSERERCIIKLKEIAGTMMGVGYTLQKDI